MRGFEIAALLSQFEYPYSKLCDIVTAEQLPDYVKEGDFIIINHNHHWTCLHHSFHGYELFDSCGVNLVTENFLRKTLPKSYFFVEFNLLKLQSDRTKTCGLMCAYYIIHRALDFDIPYREFLSTHFYTSVTKNEKLVKDFFQDGICE